MNKGYIESEFSEIDIKNLSTYQTTKWKKIVNLEIIEELKNA